MQSYVAGIFGEAKSGKKESIKAIIQRKLEPMSRVEHMRDAGMFLRAYSKMCVDGMLDLVYVPPTSEVLLGDIGQILSSCNTAILVIDVLVGCTPVVERVLEKIRKEERRNMSVLVFINKIDNADMSPLGIVKTVGEIVEQLQQTKKEFALCIGSAKYKLAVYMGEASAYAAQACQDEICRKLEEFRNTVYLAQSHPKDLKKHLWDNQLLDVVDKSSSSYKECREVSCASDMLVHTFKLLSLSRSVLAWVFSHSTSTSCCRVSCTPEIPELPELPEIRTLGFTEVCGEYAVLVRASALSAGQTFKTSSTEHTIKRILATPDKHSSLFLVQVSNPYLLKTHLENPAQSKHTIYVEISGLSTMDFQTTRKHSLMYHGISLHERKKSTGLSPTPCTSHAPAPSVFASAVDPVYLESFLHTLQTTASLGQASFSLPKYYTGRILMEKHAYLNISIGKQILSFNIRSTFLDNSSAAHKHCTLDSLTHSTCSLPAPALVSTYTPTPTSESNLACAIEESMVQVQECSDTLPLLYTHTSLALEESGTPLPENALYCVSKKLEIFLRTQPTYVVEQRLSLHLTLCMVHKHFPPDLVKALPFRVSHSAGGKAVLKHIVRHCRGVSLSTHRKHGFLFVSRVSVPASSYTLFLSLLSTAFQSYNSVISEVNYQRLESPGHLHPF
ncbi:hypothetical protein NECID01_1335 [Nematocida sp. AWRm77]|nr:hypothetical protein NECID01_1335 [Nematocida sp. AWRm77]